MCSVRFWNYVREIQQITKAMETSVNNAVIITTAVCSLHNMIIEEEGVATNITDDMVQTTDALLSLNSVDRGATKLANHIRDSFTEYFCSDEGAVPWQNYVALLAMRTSSLG